ncbi:hypothetical protein SY88_08750 [Clostridiales bacterium PH28_bin88]|nr:hypothetical protein SY88_08750 [Clostridiales bacterium PH28_bin88]
MAWQLVAKGSKATDILEAEGELEKIPASSLESMIKARGATPMAVGVRLLIAIPLYAHPIQHYPKNLAMPWKFLYTPINTY